MFWKKKKTVAATVEMSHAGTGTSTMETASLEAKVSEGKSEKLPGPKTMPEILGNHLVKQMKKEPGWAWRLSVVTRPRSGGEKGFDVRIFAENEARSSGVKVKDYTTFDQYPNLIFFEGWFDKESKQVELEEKRVIPKVVISTEKEIKEQVEALTEASNKVHFYLSASPASGGPLKRGAALVELNPKYPGKGQKKYILTAVSVDGTELTGKGIRMFESDKSSYIARWIKERHFNAEG